MRLLNVLKADNDQAGKKATGSEDAAENTVVSRSPGSSFCQSRNLVGTTVVKYLHDVQIVTLGRLNKSKGRQTVITRLSGKLR